MTAFLGTVRAAALVVDVALIGEREARARVLDVWSDGTRLLQLPDGAWLVALGEPMTVRAERSFGMPLVDLDGALVAPGLDRVDGSVVLFREGVPVSYRLADLPPVDLSSWVDTSALAVELITPADSAPSPRPIAQPRVTDPDLRAVAGVGEPSPGLEKLARKAAPVALTILMAAAVVFVTLVVAGANGIPRIIVAFLLGVLYGLFRVARGAVRLEDAVGGGSRRRKDRLAWLARTPLAQLFRGRHERYLYRLTQAFRRGDWENALRDAMAFGDGDSGKVNLRVPDRRTGALRPTPALGDAAGSSPYGFEVQRHLTGLYRQAAARLESEGRIEEAAFVLADLLNDGAAAVDLLERHGRLRLAAELAEGRGLPGELAVRLWWRAGERARAIEVARSRGAFAAGVELLSKVDKEGADSLRAEWAKERSAAGDHLGAVEAAWPVPALRSLVLHDIQAGMALGGPVAARLFAHFVAEWANDRAIDSALALLDADDPALVPVRDAFMRALLAVEVTDKGLDRRLCGAALRSLAYHGVADDWSKKLTKSLSDRADPVLAADFVRPRTRQDDVGPLHVEATVEPGQLPVHDAVALPGGAILVAHGHHGVRLLTLDGRVRARWTVAAHHLVVADHGGSALLVGVHGEVREVHVLDLAARTVRHWTTLGACRIADTYDGGLVLIVEGDDIAVLDVHAEQPRALRTLIEPGMRVHLVARDPHSLAALVEGRHLEIWRWDLPALMLRSRTRVDHVVDGDVLLAGGEFTGSPGASASGRMFAVSNETGTHVSVAAEYRATVVFPAPERIGLRAHGAVATLWDPEGRIVAVDTDRRQVVARLSTRVL